ncbi:MAG: hypothetical protein M3220_18395 [Chloroflexota bacterium]|nr:hypothetical protein [Chloroflexota bacterium]
MLYFFYHQARAVAHEPSFLALLDSLRARHGDAFTSRWQQVESGATLPDVLPQAETGTVTIMHRTVVGEIDYLISRALQHFPHGYQLLLYTPLGPDNQQRHRQLEATIDPEPLYWPNSI